TDGATRRLANSQVSNRWGGVQRIHLSTHPRRPMTVYDLSKFGHRHLGPRQSGVEEMLEALGYDSLDALTTAAMPANIVQEEPLDLPEPLTETQTKARLRELASKNTLKRSMIGQGFYDTITPAVIRRNVTENP